MSAGTEIDTGSPRSPSRGLARALSAGRLDAASACFSREGCLITPGGTAVRGRAEIRAVFAQLIARGVEVAVESSALLVSGDVALVWERWTISSPAAGAQPFVQDSEPAFVLRRLEESWKLAIAAPWGWGG